MSQMFGFDIDTDIAHEKIELNLRKIWTDVAVDVFRAYPNNRLVCEFQYFYRNNTPRDEIAQIANYLTSIIRDGSLYYRTTSYNGFYAETHQEPVHLEALYSEEYTSVTPELEGANMHRFPVRIGVWKVGKDGRLAN